MRTTTLRSVARICSASCDDVTKVSVILASHPLKSPPPSFPLSSFAYPSSLLIPGSLFVSQFPCVFIPNLLPRLFFAVLTLYTRCPSASLFLPLNSHLTWFWLGPNTPPSQILPRSSFFFLPSFALPHSVWLSSITEHRRSDADRMWGQTRRGSKGAWAAENQTRGHAGQCGWRSQWSNTGRRFAFCFNRQNKLFVVDIYIKLLSSWTPRPQRLITISCEAKR